MALGDMRAFLIALEEAGDLVRITRPVKTRFEIAAGMRRTSDIGGPALAFEEVEGHDMTAVGALFAHRRRVLLGMETDEQGFFERYDSGFDDPLEPVTVRDAPCQEVVLDGPDATFDRLPVCWHNEGDGGPFITMGLQFAVRQPYGNNVSISRMQIHDETHAGVMSVPPQHLGVYFAEAEAEGEDLPVAVTIGDSPYLLMASQIQGSIYLDEVTIAGGWMGTPVEMVRCKTIDVAVPASSEIVLEGEMLAGERRLEGPFGEFPGYYQDAKPHPVFRLRAITHRRDPVYFAGLTGEPSTDNHALKQAIYEAVIHRRLRQICPTLRDVCLTTATGGAHLVVSLKPTFAAQSRDVLLAALVAERVRPKMVIVVDDDIDPRDPAQVEWAVAYRTQADRDFVILPRQRGFALDPSSPEPWLGAIVGIDATKPFGKPFPRTTRVPGAEHFVIPGWTDAAE